MTNRIPVLATSRGERVRLETMLSDVWTRDALPFPGMFSRPRNEHPIRASASSMMRKLSVVSIASNFSKRSASLASIASITRAADDDSLLEAEISQSSAVVEHHSSGLANSVDDTSRPQYSSAHPEKEHTARNSQDGYGSLREVRRLATLKGKSSSRGWTHHGQSIINPPLRTSSTNSLSQPKISAQVAVPDSVMEEKENSFQLPDPAVPMRLVPSEGELKQEKQSKWKGVGKRKTAEGILSLFH